MAFLRWFAAVFWDSWKMCGMSVRRVSRAFCLRDRDVVLDLDGVVPEPEADEAVSSTILVGFALAI